MKTLTLIRAAALVVLISISAARAEEARFMSSPDISGDRIVFSYEGDLWTVGADGGIAARLTSFPDEEISPRYSPDGRWIAFIGNYDGPASVYAMPAGGGVPRRLTWASGVERTVAWTPDGRRVIFSTFIEKVTQRDPVLYSAGLDDSRAPERLPIDRGSWCSYSPDGRRLAYNRNTYMPVNWKRYKGGRHADIWIHDLDGDKFAPLDNYDGLSACPMWIGGQIYFISDRFGGVANLCSISMETHAVEQLTRHADRDVMEPESDGKRIVYLQDGALNLFDTANGRSRRLKVEVPSDHWQMRDRAIDPRTYIHSTNVSNSGKSVALEARGDLYTLPAGKGQVRNLSKDCGSRELYPAFSPDGARIAFFSDRTGEYQLYLQPAAGGPWTTLTTTLDCYPDRPQWSPDGKRILFGIRRHGIYSIEVATRKLITVDETCEGGTSEFAIGDYGWAPDSNWICYTATAENDNGQVFLYSLKADRRYPVTNDFYDNSDPAFDRNGDNLYFLSSRNFDVRRDRYGDNHIIANPYKVMVVQLRAGQQPPFEEKDDEAAPAPKSRPTPGPKKKMSGRTAAKNPSKASQKNRPAGASGKAGAARPAAATAATTQPAELKIDTMNFARRTFALPVAAGEYSSLNAAKGRVLWLARVEGGGRKLHVFDMKERKDAVIEDSVNGYALSENTEQIIVNVGQEYAVSTLEKLRQAKKTGDKLKLSGMVYNVDTVREWTQIFNDTWRWYREYFYDASMHGHDWKALGERYRAMIPSLTSRNRLNFIMQDMIGELCASHCYISGGDNGDIKTPAPPVFTGCLGADLAWDPAAGRYQLKRILGPTEYNLDIKGPLSRPDVRVKEGDWLLAINGTPLRDRADYNRLLQVTAGQKVTVTVNDKPTTAGARTYTVDPIASDRDLRYWRWVSDNIDKVLKATKGRVGYMHFRDMSDTTIAEFDKFWRAFHTKDGIIIDVRGNSGGSTEYFLIDKLERRQVGFFVRRNTSPYPYPDEAGTGQQRYVAISNGDNGSCGELFLAHFKTRDLGKVVGTRSWGGLIGIYTAMNTVDNGAVNQPNVGFYGASGNWWVENHGIDPDVELDNSPGPVMAGTDPQLDKAIEVMLADIEKTKKENGAKGAKGDYGFPPVPTYPKR